MIQAIYTSHPNCKQLQILLSHLQKSKIQTSQLTEMAYEWCSVIHENYSILKGAKALLFLSLEIGFRHVNPKRKQIKLIHTEHHQKLANIVFSSGVSEAITDLLCAWTSKSSSNTPYPQLKMCAEHLIGLHLHPFSSRLRSHIIYAIRLIGYKQFEQVGVEGFIRLLNDLHVCAKDLDIGVVAWLRLLLDTIKSSEGIHHLSCSYWELLVGLIAHWSRWLRTSTYSPHIMISLQDAKEWDKLTCWIGVVWMVWPPESGRTTKEDLEHVMLSLFHQQPGALQKLEEHMEQWSKAQSSNEIPKSFEQICKQAHDKAAQQATL